VLDHVDAEEVVRELVDRPQERRADGGEPEEERRRAPERPRAPAPGAAQIDGRGDREERTES